MTREVSVIVATYDRRAALLRLLPALAQQTVDASQFEVVVVDDGSSDGTAEAVAALVMPYPLRLVRQPNGGPGAARQAGVAASTGRVLLFLDDDMVPEPQLLAEHLTIHGHDPHAVVLGHITAPPPGVPRPHFVRYGERMLARDYERLRHGTLTPGWRHCYAGNVSMPRALFLDAGGFDVTVRRNEDLELGYRLMERGGTFHFSAGAVTVHHSTHASYSAWRQTAYRDGIARMRTFEKLGLEQRLHPAREYHTRHVLNRLAVRLCIPSDAARQALSAVLRGAGAALDAIGLGRLVWYAYSAIHSVNYFAGVRDAVGGARAFRRALRSAGGPSGPAEDLSHRAGGRRR